MRCLHNRVSGNADPLSPVSVDCASCCSVLAGAAADFLLLFFNSIC